MNVKHESTWVTTAESSSLALYSALSFLFRSQVGPIIASLRAEKPLEIPRGFSIGQPRITMDGAIEPFTLWVNTPDSQVVELIQNGLLGTYFDGVWLGGYLFEVPFIEPVPVLSAARHTTLEDRFVVELGKRALRQSKKRKSGVWESRIQVRADGTVTLPFQEQVVRRVPIR